MNREPIVHRWDQDGLVIEIARHLSIIRQVLLPQFLFLLYWFDWDAPGLFAARRIHIEWEEHILAFFTHPARVMMSVYDAFSTHVVAEVRLISFFSLLNLLVSKRFNLWPSVSELLTVVDCVLPLIKCLIRALFHLVHLQALYAHQLLLDEHLHEAGSFVALTRFDHEVQRKDELRVIQDALINQRLLHQRFHKLLDSLHLGLVTLFSVFQLLLSTDPF